MRRKDSRSEHPRGLRFYLFTILKILLNFSGNAYQAEDWTIDISIQFEYIKNVRKVRISLIRRER